MTFGTLLGLHEVDTSEEDFRRRAFEDHRAYDAKMGLFRCLTQQEIEEEVRKFLEWKRTFDSKADY